MGRAISVLGMHRSGTSCLTGILQQAGLHLGDVVTSAPFNKKGNREYPEIMSLNEDVLNENGGSWDNPVKVINWSSRHADERDAIIAAFRSNGHERWGFKDPRTLITLDFWTENFSFDYIGTARHPMAVARSLAHRNSFELDKGINLWYIYNKKMIELWNKENFPIMIFGVDQDRYIRMCREVIESLGLDNHGNIDFFDSLLINQKFDYGNEPELPDAVSELWDKLLDVARR